MLNVQLWIQFKKSLMKSLEVIFTWIFGMFGGGDVVKDTATVPLRHCWRRPSSWNARSAKVNVPLSPPPLKIDTEMHSTGSYHDYIHLPELKAQAGKYNSISSVSVNTLLPPAAMKSKAKKSSPQKSASATPFQSVTITGPDPPSQSHGSKLSDRYINCENRVLKLGRSVYYFEF